MRAVKRIRELEQKPCEHLNAPYLKVIKERDALTQSLKKAEEEIAFLNRENDVLKELDDPTLFNLIQKTRKDQEVLQAENEALVGALKESADMIKALRECAYKIEQGKDNL